ncbi:histidinol-phosphate transaminase [Brunnivagina elsteri]|uniref:Histidinol-phosphate aminotransferase n=1 Tax=Brunnivagina elsteri CCALA 953 TaxID=987040 RepID=A0A2A2TMD5_9CYAN|nr:histidinol-phosphate transaminase [Calothrix elsteri]PAX59590.1 histidinol-phosphate aminotransferase [Calothrix elsteri CCALA 953]
MLPYIRQDLAQFSAYKPHPGSDSTEPVTTQYDRLDTNESPYDLPTEFKEKLAWTYQQLIETNRYPDGGHEELKNAIADYVNESANLSKSAFTSENISVGNGSDELIRSLLIASCVGGNGSILVANPTFSMYGILAQTLGVNVINVARKEENFEIDLKAAQSALENTQNPPIRAIFVVHPNSPTANALTDAEITWLKKLPEHILVIVDEAYFEFSQNTLVSEIQKHPNWVVMRTFSKAFRLAAMRVGYCIANAELISVLEKVRLPYNLPSFSLAAALLAIQNRQILLDTIPQTIDEREKLQTTLSQQPQLKVWNSATNFIYLKPQIKASSSSSISTEDFLVNLTQELRRMGTLVRHTCGGMRITVGSPEENARTLIRIQTVLEKLYS